MEKNYDYSKPRFVHVEQDWEDENQYALVDRMTKVMYVAINLHIDDWGIMPLLDENGNAVLYQGEFAEQTPSQKKWAQFAELEQSFKQLGWYTSFNGDTPDLGYNRVVSGYVYPIAQERATLEFGIRTMLGNFCGRNAKINDTDDYGVYYGGYTLFINNMRVNKAFYNNADVIKFILEAAKDIGNVIHNPKIKSKLDETERCAKSLGLEISDSMMYHNEEYNQVIEKWANGNGTANQE